MHLPNDITDLVHSTASSKISFMIAGTCNTGEGEVLVLEKQIPIHIESTREPEDVFQTRSISISKNKR